MKLKEILNAVLAIDPASGAIEYAGVWHDWRSIAHIAESLERELLAAGVAPGAPVGVLMRNRPGQFSSLVGLILAGRTIITLNPMYPPATLAKELETLRLPAIIGEAADWSEPVRKAAAAAGTVGIEVLHEGETRVRTVTGLEQAGSGPFHPAKPGVLVEMLTSGTTGAPKRIEISADAFAKSLAAGVWSQKPGESRQLKRSPSVLFVSLLHISGFYRGLFAIFEGRPTILMDRFEVEPWCDAVRKYRPRTMGLPPTAMRMILDANVPKEDLSSFIAITAGTAPLSPETRAEFEERYGVPVLCNYGATEFLGPVATWTISDHHKFSGTKTGSVGKAIAGTELRCVDPETGTVLATGETGILEVRLTRFGPDADWVRTTDLASIDEDGFLYIHGRADAAIIRGGFKIQPETVARALEQHPSVSEAAVVGVDDPRLGAVPAAAVELTPGVDASEAELLDFARHHLIAYQVPVRILIVDELPRTPSMKVALPAVRALFG